MTRAHRSYLSHKLIPVPVLLFFILLQPFRIQAQSQHAFKNEEDSFFIIRNHSKWHPYGGLHISSDAELYYAGPSFEAGFDANLTRRLLFSTYIHYYHGKVDNTDNTGVSSLGRFKTFTVASLIQVNPGAGWYKGFFIGLGMAVQFYSDHFKSNLRNLDVSRTTLTPAIRMGYTFPAGLHAIAIEFNGIGPYTEKDGTDQYMEVFTQVSLGARFIF
jgi:hypothetical protein